MVAGRTLTQDQVHALLVELCRLVDADPQQPRLPRPWEVLVERTRVGLTAGGRGSPATAVLALVDIAWLALAGPVEKDTPRRRQRMVDVAGPDLGGLLADVLLDPAAWSPARLGSELQRRQPLPAATATGAQAAGRHRHAAVPGAVGGSPLTVRAAPQARALRRVLASVGLAVVVTVVLGTVRAGWYVDAGASGSGGAAPAATQANPLRLVPVTSTPSRPPAGQPPALTDPTVRDPRATLAAALATRSDALMSGRLDRIVDAVAPHSTQLAADRDVVEQLNAGHERYDRLAFVVRSAQVARRSDAAVWVSAVVDRSAYLVIDAADRQLTRPSSRGRALLYEMRLVDGRWRLAGVYDNAASGSIS